MNPKHTAATVAHIITTHMEPQTAEAVLAALAAVDGQLITTRLLDKLPGGRVEWRLTRNYGWTEIKNRAYYSSQGDDAQGVSIMLARSEASVPLSAAWVEKENPAYFAGRRQRNALRAAALANATLLAAFAEVLNHVERIHADLATTKAQFGAYVAHGEPLSPDHYEFERACGLREARK